LSMRIEICNYFPHLSFINFAMYNFKDHVKSVLCICSSRPTFHWSGADHWNVINISHHPNVLSIANQKSVKNSV
jgi:hypothetical protein